MIAALAGSSCAVRDAADLLLSSDTHDLRERPEGSPQRSPRHPGLTVIAIDGVDRTTLYDLLREGSMPNLSILLAGPERELSSVYFEENMLSTLPSTTMAAWVTALTGKPPAEHGVTGNEFFMRDSKTFAAPVPVTFTDPEPLVENLTDGYTNKFVRVRSVFEQMRERDPNVLIWVAMMPFNTGADLLLQSDRTTIADAGKAFLQHQVIDRMTAQESAELYETLDEEVIEAVVEQLEKDGPPPDVLFVYVSGTDQYAHVAKEGPDKARRKYLTEALDPELGKLVEALAKKKALNRYVMVTSDHGHTEVTRDKKRALATDMKTDPPAVLSRIGFRVRPFEWKVDTDHDFQAVLAYQGAIAYVYLADRSTCPKSDQPCDWKKPPRFQEDVLATADAFFRASRDGLRVPALKGAIDMVLARKPKAPKENDDPFQVYAGNGKLVPIADYLADHPHPTYVAVAERLGDLAVGPAGDRAGDVLLIAVNGNRERPEDRFYFSDEYQSWHGSPSRRDSEIPFIVGHPKRSKGEIAEVIEPILGKNPRQQHVTDVMLALRYGRERD